MRRRLSHAGDLTSFPLIIALSAAPPRCQAGLYQQCMCAAPTPPRGSHSADTQYPERIIQLGSTGSTAGALLFRVGECPAQVLTGYCEDLYFLENSAMNYCHHKRILQSFAIAYRSQLYSAHCFSGHSVPRVLKLGKLLTMLQIDYSTSSSGITTNSYCGRRPKINIL